MEEWRGEDFCVTMLAMLEGVKDPGAFVLSCLTGRRLEARLTELSPLIDIREAGIKLTTRFVKSVVLATSSQQDVGKREAKGQASAGLLTASGARGTCGSDESQKVGKEYPWSKRRPGGSWKRRDLSS